MESCKEAPQSAIKAEIKKCLENKSLYLTILSNPEGGSKIRKITIRPIETKAGELYQLSEQQKEKVFHRNISRDELFNFLFSAETSHFKQTNYYTENADYQLLKSKKGKETLLKKKPSKQNAIFLPHNRLKNYLLAEGAPIPFLIQLGVMNEEGKVYPKKMDKFRQINRFLEIIEDTLSEIPKSQELQILDFGCGKSYLTFALYYYLHQIKNIPSRIVGLDLKREVIDFCNLLAQKLGYTQLKFEVGSIEGYVPEVSIDLVICLHACNTATDFALENAVRWQAKAILAVPCCQHELYHQVEQPLLASLLRHGILKERFAALVTDAARADWLEISGYRCQIMEFIDLEHTPKNLLIKAILGNELSDERNKSMSGALARYEHFAHHLKIYPTLAAKLGL